MSNNIIFAGDQRLVQQNADVVLANLLEQENLGMEDSVKMMKELAEELKGDTRQESMKLKLELIKHIQALHGSKASLKNVQIGIFMHPGKNEKLIH